MNGYGVYEWLSGAKYEGYWKNNKKEGKGKKIFDNGDVYIGDWINDKAHGYGIKFDANGD